jgi:tetratricopeptide (TPR) repeat protein
MTTKMKLTILAVSLLLTGVPAIAADVSDLIRKGEAQMQQGDAEGAVKTLEHAVTQNPDSSLGYTRLGGAQVLQRDYDAGIASFQKAITLDEKNANAFVGMAVAYLHQGRYPLARAALEEAKRIDPSKQERVDELLAWIDQRTSQHAY